MFPMGDIDLSAFQSRAFGPTAVLYRAGGAFDSLYIVLTGVFSTSIALADGRTQVTDSALPGDLIGMDGIASGCFTQNAVALTESAVAVIPYKALNNVKEHALFHSALARRMSAQIERQRWATTLLGTMSVEERVVAFLVDFAMRTSSRKRGWVRMALPMTQTDIGNYLGAKRESVNRVFNSLEARRVVGYTGVGKGSMTLDLAALRKLLPKGYQAWINRFSVASRPSAPAQKDASRSTSAPSAHCDGSGQKAVDRNKDCAV